MERALQERYDRRTIWLHWATAIIVIVEWLIGRLNHFLPKGPLRLDIWSIHVVLGFALGAIILARIWWRLTQGRRLPPTETGLLHLLAKLTHALLYALLIGVVFLGVWNSFARGFPFFGVWNFPKFGGDYHPVNEWHDLFANLLAALAAVHALAALFHHYVLRDTVLGRMLSGAAA
jgi:cytochrome b561